MELKEFQRAYEVIKKLRDPDGGCPWDIEQTHKTLTKYAIEEAYEFSHAVEKDNTEKMEEELGDMLLQVLLHSVIGAETDRFTIESVSKVLADKIVHRHPHVFGEDAPNIKYEEVKEKWEEMKAQERGKKDNQYYIDEEIIYCPSLVSAEKIGHKTNKVNFDWEDAGQVLYKVEEEWQELKEEIAPGVTPNKDRVKEELGDLLFSVAQLARHLDLSAEECLKEANQKFLSRFQTMEDKLNAEDKKMTDMTQNELEQYWQYAKAELKK
jgi:MazG family protein